jgi:hypothetical protein
MVWKQNADALTLDETLERALRRASVAAVEA